MSNLGPQQQNQSFSGLLQIPGGVTRELQQVQDGEGNPTGLQVSSLGINAVQSLTLLPTITGVAGSDASVTNAGTIYDPQLQFTIPAGAAGLSVDTVAALRLVASPAAQGVVQTLGYRTKGDGGGGFWYWNASLNENDNSGTIVLPTGWVGAGRWVRVDAYTSPSNVLWWGAYRDNTNAATTTAAIQAAIDWSIYQFKSVGYTSLGRVYIPGGVYSVNDAIQVGYGETFHSCFVYGDGPRFVGENFNGTALVATFNDRPVFAVSGGRNTTIRDLCIVGTNYNWINTNQLGTTTTPLVNDLVASNWVDPAFPASASARYSPYCAIAIDPYAGTQPLVHYPNVTYPAWSGIATQYGKAYSSNTLIENVELRGFVVGIANQPSDADGNADYTKLHRCSITYCQYGVAICNTQSRLVDIIDSTIVVVYTGVVTTKFGRQAGKPSINVLSTEIGNCIKWLDIPNLDYGGAPKFESCYGEVVYSIGNAGANASSQSPILFLNCDFSFTDSWNVRGVPSATYMQNGRSFATFDTCNFAVSTYFMSVVLKGGINSSYINVNNCFVQNDPDTPPPVSVQYAMRSTYGMTFGGSSITAPTSFNARNQCSSSSWWAALPKTVCMWYKDTSYLNIYPGDPGIPIYGNLASLDKSIFTPTVSGRTIALNIVSYTSAWCMYQYFTNVGDILIDSTTGVPFVIKSVVGTVVTAYAMTGFDASGNMLDFVANIGTFYSVPGRLFCIDTCGSVLYGNTTSGNNTMSSIARDDNYSDSFITNVLTTNDYVFAPELIDQVVPVNLANITGLTSTSIQTAGNFKNTATHRRMPLIIKAAPANEA